MFEHLYDSYRYQMPDPAYSYWDIKKEVKPMATYTDDYRSEFRDRMGYYPEGYPTPRCQPTMKQKVSAFARRIFDKDTTALVDAGMLSCDLEITDQGRDLILSHYLKANKKELADEARKLLEEEE